MRRADDGLPKMWIIHHALRLRREHPEWFGTDAAYLPLNAEGSKADHLIACMRGDSVIAVVPRLVIRLDGAWRRTRLTLPEGRWINRLTGESLKGGSIEVENLLRHFPVALLTRETDTNA
jgi:(1->4)-alpha-D-glucan 1-alpha-D-glucosylmutase